jgi:hypothetical protein
MITTQPQDLIIGQGQKAILQIASTADDARVLWYEGTPEGGHRFIEEGDDFRFISSEILRSTSFFAIVLTPHGEVTSQAANVSLDDREGSLANPVPNPGQLVAYRGQNDQVFYFDVTGNTTGEVWGTDVYTDDSLVAKAAIHAGLLSDGETAILQATILPGQSSYQSSTRHGIDSSSYGSWLGSYSLQLWQAGTITGLVVDAQTAAPLSGMSVSAGGIATTITDSNGRYRLDSAPAGLVVVKASGEGYEAESATVDLIGGEAVTLNFELHPLDPSIMLAIRRNENNQIEITWEGGTPPCNVEYKNALGDPEWQILLNGTMDRQFTIDVHLPAQFYRVVEATGGTDPHR